MSAAPPARSPGATALRAATEAAGARALEGLRVLELASRATQYCGKLFADLGAEVILVEPPQGATARRDGPFVDDRAQRETSLAFAYENSGKRSVCVDARSPDGLRLLRELVARSDLLLEGGAPGSLAALGLEPARLRAEQPALVITSITPFGQTGPYSSWAADELVLLALGGLLYLGGYADGTPIAVYGDQATQAGALFGAVGSMIALFEAEGAGRGRWVDVSIQESVVMALENAVPFYELEGRVRRRFGGQQRQAGTGVFECRDGFVYMMAGGVASNQFWRTSVQWMIDERIAGAERLLEPQWDDQRYLASDEAKEIFGRLFDPFARSRSKAELYREAQRRRIPLCPVSTPADLLGSAQLAHRGYFRELVHAYTGRTLRAPGAPYQLSETSWRVSRPAPMLGQHTGEVLAELGYDAAAQRALIANGAVA